MAASTAPGQPGAGSSAAEPRMRAVVQDRYGPAEVLHLSEIARPSPGTGEVLVQVRAAGLDRGTWHLMTGQPYLVRLAIGLRGPRNPVPGRDVAGVVAAVGAGVEGLQPGDEVFGVAKGSFAEYAVARPGKLAPKPAGLTFEQAAAMPVSGLAALQGLCDVGRLEAGQHVLILGASGGMGTFAVQIAKAFGATVTGVCSTAKVDLVRSLGADHVVDYTRDDAVGGSTRFDLVLDIGGSTPVARLRGALTPRGTLVIAGGEGGGRWFGGLDRQLRALAASPFVRQRLTTFYGKEQRSGLERLSELVERGQLVPVVDRAYPLDEAAAAMRRLEAGEARGKLVVTP